MILRELKTYLTGHFSFNSLFPTSFLVLFSLKLRKAVETSLLCLASGAAHSPFFLAGLEKC